MTKILVIEDSRDLREDVVEMLNLEGYDANGAENGVVGISKALESPPDLIVCDIMMPELDGYGVLEALRDEPSTKTIPFIFLTAKAERMSLRHGMVLGADDYLTKPFMVDELLESIQTQLRKRQELNEAADERLEELRRNIITALPHELRTPLNTIIGFSDMLTTEAQRLKPDQVISWSSLINDAAHRLYRLVENHLYYVRLQVAVKDLQNARTDEPLWELPHILASESMRIAEKYERKADLQIDVADQTQVFIEHEDATKIISELVDNAFKFSQAGTPVVVRTENRDGRYVLTVSDQGEGMTAEEITSIGAYMQFERWLREQQGMGLGLAVVKLLSQMYGATFSISSEPPTSGTCVEIGFKVG